MSVRVRRAEREDASTLVHLIRALADFEQLDPPNAEAEARLLADGWPENGSPRFMAWLAEIVEDRNTTAVGYAITFYTYSSFLARPTLYLEDLFVLPDARRAGIGTALLERLVAEAKATGCGRMEWVVLDWNVNAQRFYERHGAERLQEWQAWRLTGERLVPKA